MSLQTRGRLLLAALTAVSAAALGAWIAPPASAHGGSGGVAPTLTGEQFLTFEPLPSATTSASCSGQPGWISYRTTGAAAGPYPGTFTEYGWVKLGPPQAPSGRSQILRLYAVFTIESPVGRVTGTKVVNHPLPFPASSAGCDRLTGALSFTAVGASYYASIKHVSGARCYDRGTSRLELFYLPTPGPFSPGPLAIFTEDFVSSDPDALCGSPSLPRPPHLCPPKLDHDDADDLPHDLKRELEERRDDD